MTNDQYMILEEFESLNEDNTVGILHGFKRGPSTVRFDDVGFEITGRLDDDIGDEESRLFLSCESGELSVHYGPNFAPIETNLSKGQARLALDSLEGYGPADREFTLLFDDKGPVVFKRGDAMTVTSPMCYNWGTPRAQSTYSPTCGPSIINNPD